MIRAIVLAGAVALASPAFAQEQPPTFVPYQVDQQSHVAMMNFLQEVPAKYAIPIMQKLTELSHKAAEAKASEQKPANQQKEALTPQPKS